MIATVTTDTCARTIVGQRQRQRLRRGACGSPRGAARMVADISATVDRLRTQTGGARGGGAPKALLRADSEFYGHPDPSPEGGPVDSAAKPSRRTFTVEYRNKIIDDYSQDSHGQKSAVLRREGLYQSQLREWTQARDAAGSDTRKSRSPQVEQ